MTQIYAALTLWGLTNLCMVLMGINGVRYARTLQLGWVTYIALGGWIFFGLLGWVRMLTVVQMVLSGLPENYQGIGILAWIGLITGFLFTLFLSVAMWQAVRNARTRTEEEREAITAMHQQMFRVQRILRNKNA